mgnify:CR=1 FL=1|tara:strand:- start:420 stop:818 length:399 start_codon:yes stop_codon:yes gene_type:complete
MKLGYCQTTILNSLKKSFVKYGSELVPEVFQWGEILWLMNEQIDPRATQTVGICTINPGESNYLHYHPNCEEILYVLSGSCLKSIGDDSFEMSAGDVVRIPREKPHSVLAIGKEPLKCLITYNVPDRKTVLL